MVRRISKLSGLLLDGQCRQTRTKRVVFQRDRRTEQHHDAVAGELVDGTAETLHDFGRAIEQFGHDLAQPLGPQRRRQIHRMHHVRKQHGDLLVLGRLGALGTWLAAFAAEFRRYGEQAPA